MSNIVNKKSSLGHLVDSLIFETLKGSLHDNGIKERERQQRMLPEEDDDSEETKSTSSKTMDSEKEKLKTGNITSEDIVSKLNAVRAGRSFKHEDVSRKLSEYVESLTKAERTALLSFLKGIAQIVSGEVDIEDVSDPGEDPADVKMKKQIGVHTRTIKPNVIKKPSEPESKAPSSSDKEDTSGPVPIKAKK